MAVNIARFTAVIAALYGCSNTTAQFAGDASVDGSSPSMVDGATDVRAAIDTSVDVSEPMDVRPEDVRAAVDISVDGSTPMDVRPDVSVDSLTDARSTFDVSDAVPCRESVAEVQKQTWVEPCPTKIEASGPPLKCAGYIGARIYKAACSQRRTYSWQWGSHSQTCFYEGDALVGVELTNDVPAFCNSSLRAIQGGAVERCAAGAEMEVLNCIPKGLP